MEGEKKMNFSESLKSFVKKLGLIRDVWVNDKNGDSMVVSKEQIESLQEDFNTIQQMLSELMGQVGEKEQGFFEEIKQNMLTIEGVMAKGNPELISRISAIFESGLGKIGELSTIKVGEFKAPEEYNNGEIEDLETNETSKKKARGGNIATISTKGFEHQPESDENGEKKIGGAIISKKNGEFGQELTGEYVNKENAIENINAILVAALAEIDKVKDGDSLENQNISEIIRKNFREIRDRVKQTADKIPNPKIKGVAVKAKTILTKKAVALMLVGASALSGIAGYALDKSADYSIPIIEDEAYTIVDDTDELIAETEDAIMEEYDDSRSAIQEEIDNGTNPDATPEQTSSQTAAERNEELNEYKENIDRITAEYESIENPTNADYIEYQRKILEEKQKIIGLLIEIKGGDKEALEAWNDSNEEHIDSGNLSPNATYRHESQNDLNDSRIETLEEEIEDLENQIQENDEKINFYSKVKGLNQIEDVSNIEDFTETLYEFCGDNEVSPDELIQMLNKDGTNLELFSAYAKVMMKSEDDKTEGYEVESVLAEYELLENTYNEYVDQYGESPEYSSYANYYKSVREEYMQELGEGGNFFEELSQKLQQDNMNKRFYEQVHQEKVGPFKKVKQFFETLFDSVRRDEYNKAVEGIKTAERGETTQEKPGQEI